MGSSKTGTYGGYLAIKGEHTVSEVGKDFPLIIEDMATKKEDSDKATYKASDEAYADATNTLWVYFDGTKNVYANTYLHTLFPNVDLTGYTVICFSGLNTSAFDFGAESNYWFSDTWYTGFVYYEPDYGCNFWSTVNGWQYGYSSNADTGACFWDYGTASWWYTSKTLYPWMFRYTYNAASTTWGGSWYEYTSGSAPSRVFYDWANQTTDVNEGNLPAPGY
jgi:hypothetical protein